LEGTIPNSEALTSAKANHKKAVQAAEAAKLVVTTGGAKPFKLYGNLFPNEARQSWENHQSPSDLYSLG
jgi:hypothetical protein